MNINDKLRNILGNLERSLPAGVRSVDDLVRAIDARPAGGVEAWLDQLAPVVRSDGKAELKELRAALQAAIALSKEAGVPLAELKQRAVGRVEQAAVNAVDGPSSRGPGFVLAGDAAQQQQRLDDIKRDYVAKAHAAGRPLPNIGLDEQFKSAGQAKEYIGSLLAGDMLYWAENAFQETARMEQAADPAALRAVVLGVDYSHFTGGGGPYLDYLVAKLDNNLAMPDIVDLLGQMRHYRFPLGVHTVVGLLEKLLARRAGDNGAIEKMLRDVQATAVDSQSAILAQSFFNAAAKASPEAKVLLEKLGLDPQGLAPFGEIKGQTYPDRSALESLAAIACKRPEFQAFEKELGADPRKLGKAKVLTAIDAHIAEIKSPQEFVAFALGLTGEKYRYQFGGDPWRDVPSFNVLWDVMQKHHDTAAQLGVSFAWIASLTYAAYYDSIHMASHGILFEDALKVMKPMLAHVKTPEQANQLMRSSDRFIQMTYMNSRSTYPKNYDDTWRKYQAAVTSALFENFETAAVGRSVVGWAGTVPDAIKAKRRILHLAGDKLADIQASLGLFFDRPSEAYLKENDKFVAENVRRLTDHPGFDLKALEGLLAVQGFSPGTLHQIMVRTAAAPSYARWSPEDQAATREKFLAAEISEVAVNETFRRA